MFTNHLARKAGTSCSLSHKHKYMHPGNRILWILTDNNAEILYFFRPSVCWWGFRCHIAKGHCLHNIFYPSYANTHTEGTLKLWVHVNSCVLRHLREQSTVFRHRQLQYIQLVSLFHSQQLVMTEHTNSFVHHATFLASKINLYTKIYCNTLDIKYCAKNKQFPYFALRQWSRLMKMCHYLQSGYKKHLTILSTNI